MPLIVNSAGANPPLPHRPRDERGGRCLSTPSAAIRRGHRRPWTRPRDCRHRGLAVRVPGRARREPASTGAGRALPPGRVRRPCPPITRRASAATCASASIAAPASRAFHRSTASASRYGRRPSARRCRRGRSTSRSWASARTATSPSTIRRPTSRPQSPIWSSRSTRPAAGSRSARAGSRLARRRAERAISMSIRQILKAARSWHRPRRPQGRGGRAPLEGEISRLPASILRTHAEPAVPRRRRGLAARAVHAIVLRRA